MPSRRSAGVVDNQLLTSTSWLRRRTDTRVLFTTSLICEGAEFRTISSRHGSIIWWAPAENDDIWLASTDGLVKRWSFKTGEGVRAIKLREAALVDNHVKVRPLSRGRLFVGAQDEEDFALGFTYSGKLIMVRDDYLVLQYYDAPNFPTENPD